jgi:hypothetical protein
MELLRARRAASRAQTLPPAAARLDSYLATARLRSQPERARAVVAGQAAPMRACDWRSNISAPRLALAGWHWMAAQVLIGLSK